MTLYGFSAAYFIKKIIILNLKYGIHYSKLKCCENDEFYLNLKIVVIWEKTISAVRFFFG